MKMDKYWWLGFLGFVGVYKLPIVFAYFSAGGSHWDLLNLLWFLWFTSFIPSNKSKKE